ncbi:hypothetical protein TIFTF001_026253 [Ficus carica]|uniref:Uncharacterized protein n=1 Tax=Ficus carica TaxID=3494 RepID=A0AA88IXT3_FICCA|nr:hypothetical protein TIFTF001_026253 [Ficus carica]
MGSYSSNSEVRPHVIRNPLSGIRIYMSFFGKDGPNALTMSNWIDYYDPSNDTWRRLTSLPGLMDNHAIKGFSMVAIGDFIFIVGGKLCRKVIMTAQLDHDSDAVEEVELEVRASVLRYNLRTNTWSKCSPMRIPRFDFACTVCDGRIYVVGGKCAFGSGRGLASAEVYNPAVDTWDPLPDLTTPRYKCVAVMWQGKVHVVGGFGGVEGPLAVKERCSAEVYDCESATWKLMVGMWQLDVPPNQIVAVGDKLFSSGDCLNAWKGHIEVYDGKIGIWDEVDGSYFEHISSPVSTSDATEANWPPMRRLYLTMAPIETHLYFFVSHRKPGEIARSISAVHVFDTSASGEGRGWRSFEAVEKEGERELCSHCCVGRVPQAP